MNDTAGQIEADLEDMQQTAESIDARAKGEGEDEASGTQTAPVDMLPIQDKEPLTGADYMLANLLTKVFAAISKRRGAHWNLEKPEALELGQAYRLFLQEILPLETFGAGVQAMVVTAGVVMPRMMEDDKHRERPDRSEGGQPKHPGDGVERQRKIDLDQAEDAERQTAVDLGSRR
jgi:hypothetical protein